MMAKAVEKLNGRGKWIASGTVLGVPILIVIVMLIQASMATGALTNKVAGLEKTVCTDHETRIRVVEKAVTEQRMQHKEVMRILAEIRNDIKALER